VTYSADEATGGHHISLTLAGNRRMPLEEAEQYKRSNAGDLAGGEAGVRKDGRDCRSPY
jgi:ethanolamine utilization protein EutJ